MIAAYGFKSSIEYFLQEDELGKNFNYIHSLPETSVTCSLKFKDDLVVSGLPFFFETLNYFLPNKIDYTPYLKFERQAVKKSDNAVLEFEAPFNVVLTAERLALNLLQKASSISTHTRKFVDAVENVTLLDTRKTTPGLRSVEKYATSVGGAKNHRFSQTDIFMIKDNHKNFFGGLKEALEFFKKVRSFYTPIVVEIHSLDELKLARELKVRHLMLDNFSPEEVREAVAMKSEGMTYEVSGGITLSNIKQYDIIGVDAISSGSLTYGAPPVDISLKYSEEKIGQF